ncbi:CASP8 and FADD-like apoptosis regulator isoform X1 [Sander lucioperca]|uniref:CASP8 and FADD-like apoptosis regulator n=1 Tax=Sander lucioperca TaxID=283035 RepID=A0A8C9WTV0_SANLU|nr:CASP8 and FADD-like apoptosis regulator isoform X1 [Sander lucioperca]XP_035860001.1 CASP8 and FADD-like apoptosis regulator isoform X1 [Sander lucioperca]
MALSDQLQAINQTAEALSSCERRRLFYLCEMLDTDTSEACMKDMLKVLCDERGNLFLTELMLQLKRFDILRKVYKTNRDEAEKTLKDKQVLPRFRVLMANINDDMANEDLNRVKFLLSSTLSHEQMEKAKSFLDVIIELEKLDIVSPERVDCIEECLRNIGRVDLAKKVTAYKMSDVTSEGHLSEQQMHRAPCPVPTPNSSPQQTRQAQPLHIATENVPLPIYREQNCQSQLDCYKFNTNPRGVCVIIDCVGNDGDMLEHTFKNLHFNVILYKLLSVDETILALRGILRQRENLEGDGFVCCIISRGTANYLLGTDLYAADLHLDNVRSLFTADVCPMLAGKPKLFFIQRYNVSEFTQSARTEHRDEYLETDGCDERSRCVIPTDADVFWSHCWTDDCQLEQGHHRSIYLKALTDALHKGQKRKTHLVDVHTEVNGAIYEHNKRNPGAKYNMDLKYTLRKNLYLQ